MLLCLLLRHSSTPQICIGRRREVLDTSSFETLRRENSAIRLCLGLIEYSLGIDLPDEVFHDEEFMTLYWAVVDMVDLANV